MLVASDLDEMRSSHDSSSGNESVSTWTKMDEADVGDDSDVEEAEDDPDLH